MTDHDHIRALLARYARALDRLDERLLESVFAKDARIEMGAIHIGGPAPFLPIAIGFMRMFVATRHEITTVLVEDNGPDDARVEAYVRAWHRIGEDRTLEVLGRYLVEVRRTPEGWRFAHFSEVIDWGEERATDPAWFAGNTDMPKGARDATDPSYTRA